MIWFGLIGAARADVYDYGDFDGNTVRYVGVAEETDAVDGFGNPVPLFGTPTGSGDSLDFDPVSFSAYAAAETGSPVEKRSVLSVLIDALPGYTIGVLRFNEAGDYSLLGSGGGSDTSATVTADFNIEIVQVDGNDVAPINLMASMDLNPSDGDYDMDNDNPDGDVLVQGNWTGELDVDLTQALIDAGVSFVSGVTKVNVDLTNVLTSTSEDGTSALISKKDFGGTSISVVIPLPPSVAMGLLGVAGIALLGWKQRI